MSNLEKLAQRFEEMLSKRAELSEEKPKESIVPVEWEKLLNLKDRVNNLQEDEKSFLKDDDSSLPSYEELLKSFLELKTSIK